MYEKNKIGTAVEILRFLSWDRSYLCVLCSLPSEHSKLLLERRRWYLNSCAITVFRQELSQKQFSRSPDFNFMIARANINSSSIYLSTSDKYFTRTDTKLVLLQTASHSLYLSILRDSSVSTIAKSRDTSFSISIYFTASISCFMTDKINVMNATVNRGHLKL